MTEKLKVTREQADAICQLRGYDFEDVLNMRRIRQMPYIYSALDNLTISELGLIFFNPDGYEIEPEYKEGDWVIHTDINSSGEIAKIERIVGDIVHARKLRGSLYMWNERYIRHATPAEIKAEQERRVWAKIGRDVGEFKVGDGYLYNTDVLYTIDCEQRIRVAEEAYEGDKLVGFYPAESFIEFGGESHDN